MGPGRGLFSNRGKSSQGPRLVRHGAGPVQGVCNVILVEGLRAGRTEWGPMNSEQIQSLAVLALAMVPVALLWWVWIRMLD